MLQRFDKTLTDKKNKEYYSTEEDDGEYFARITIPAFLGK